MARATEMLSATVAEPGRVELVEVPVPRPGPGEVTIRIQGCGVCGSDLALWQGKPWFEYPSPSGAPGHEAWGYVEEIGTGVTSLEPGQRVTGLTYRGFAQFDSAPEGWLVPLPDELEGKPFPGEPLACAFNVFERAGIEAGQIVAVVGIGFLGALITQLAASAGARVIALSRRGFALDVARRMGAADVVELDVDDPVAAVEELTRGQLCDRVVEATGKQAPLDVAAQLTRTRGRLVVAGFHQDGPRQVDMQLWNWRGLDVVNAHEREPERYLVGLRHAIEAVRTERLRPDPLYTHIFRLSELDTALNTAVQRPEGFVKALVRP